MLPKLDSTQSPWRRQFVSAFTLVELLVVIGIIAVLISILLPVVGRSRRNALDIYCRNNLHQISLATRMYANDHADRYPDGYTLGGAVFRVLPGMKAPGDPNAVPEVYGLPALYKQQGYLKTLNSWKCPAARENVAAWGNTYIWSLLGGSTLISVQSPDKSNVARWTSLRRGRAENLETFWVWDNFTTAPWTSGSRRTSGNYSVIPTTEQPYPHDFRAKQAVGRRQGSINCMFLDGHVGVVAYVLDAYSASSSPPTNGLATHTLILRDPT